jgi:hypothetical protein
MIAKRLRNILRFKGWLSGAAFSALTAIAAFTAFTAWAQTQGTPTPSPSPKAKASAFGRPSAAPVPSVQLPPDLLPDPQHVPVPTPPPPATNDLLPENKPAPTPIETAPDQQDLLPATPTPGPSASASGQAEESPTPKKLAEQILKEKMRFRQLQSMAERDPHSIDLWKTAGRQSTMEYRREWQRLYYVYVCEIMRKLDPSVSNLIDAWEQTHVSAESLHNTKPTVPRQELLGPSGAE